MQVARLFVGSIFTLLICQSLFAQSQAPRSASSNSVKAIVVLDPQAMKEAGLPLPARLDDSLASPEKSGEVVEAPESTPSSPPLDTDDTGTPGPGNAEINFIGGCDRSSFIRACETVIDANFGIGKKIQIKIERPYETETEAGGPTQKGLGATEVGVKYRFLDKNGWSAAIYPNYTIDNATRHEDEDGNLEPTEGRAVYFPLIVQKDIPKWKLSVVANIGYIKRPGQNGQDSVVTGLSVGHALNAKSRIMAEVYSERDAKTLKANRTDVRIGYVRVIFPEVYKHWEKSFFFSVGKGKEDGNSHVTGRAGLSFVGNIIKP
jgi:hypothetical protein